jgi:hypothetical protein
MSCIETLHCNDDARAALVKAAARNGIDTVEIVQKPDNDPLAQRVLAVFFFNGIPANLDNSHLEKFPISGGVRVPGESIRITDAQNKGDHLELTLDRYGDFSDYVLKINHDDLDPLYNCKPFNFKVDCSNLFDCQQPSSPPGPLPPSPVINYLAKDYASFRRALLNFLPTRVPGFSETSEADLAITLLELFAYAGDQLSYFQDAVANEAYLDTARQRSSLKRHALLVDYRMHDGLAARVILRFRVNSPTKVPAGFAMATNELDPRERLVFETEETAICDDEQNEMVPYTWLDADCCLPIGATSADLAGNFKSLVAGQLLLFEEVLGPVREPGKVELTAAGKDPGRRQIVRLTNVEHLKQDNLPDPKHPGARDITRVSWGREDALRVEFCLQHDTNDKPATVARGNLARASHGQTIANETVDSDNPVLQEGPVGWLHPVPPDDPNAPLTWLIPPDPFDPREARSTVRLRVNGQEWKEEPTLLDSGPNDAVFVVDTDDSGRAILRFGDGVLGRQLPPGASITAIYRVGNGSSGNVGADSLNTPATGVLPAGVLEITNPLPAVAGTDPEDLDRVRVDAPQVFRAVQYRAVTTADYEHAAATVPGVANAAATFRWSGSWLTIFVAVQPVGQEGLSEALREAVVQRLDSWRQTGYDLEVRPPEYVPLQIELHVCVQPDYFTADVIGAVLEALTAGHTIAGAKGFFNPDNFTFGQPLYLSRIYAAVQEVPGVKAVLATTFRRLNRADLGELQAGVLRVGPFEIVRLDNDPSQPDNGILTLVSDGGK